MDKNELTIKVKDELYRRGAKLIGVASVDRFSNSPAGHHPCDFIKEAKSVIVVGLPIVLGLMNWNSFLENSELIPSLDEVKGQDGKDLVWSPRIMVRKHIERRCSYEVINMELQILSMYTAILLEDYGYKSLYLPTTYGMTLSWPGNYQWDFPKIKSGAGPFSHRHAAVAAGLGEIGRNNLLLTPQYGSRVRLVSIITEAELCPDPLITHGICLGEKCDICVKSCPAKAFDGGTIEYYIAGMKQNMCKVNIEKCRGFYKDSAMGEQCGRECINSCPVSKSRKT